MLNPHLPDAGGSGHADDTHKRAARESQPVGFGVIEDGPGQKGPQGTSNGHTDGEHPHDQAM